MKKRVSERSKKNLKPFGRGHDPRRNLAGRPRTFDAFRAMVQDFLAQPTTKNRTKLDKLLQDMARTKVERKILLEYAFGKVPQPITGKDEEPLRLNVVGFEEALEKIYGDRYKGRAAKRARD